MVEIAYGSASVAVLGIGCEVGFAAVACRCIAVGKTGIARGKSAITPRAHSARTGVGRSARLPTPSAALHARVEIGLAAVCHERVAITKALAACDRAGSFVTGGCSIGAAAHVVARPAIGSVRVGVGFTAVRILGIAVREPGGAVDRAGGIQARGSAIGGNTRRATGATMQGVVCRRGFATVTDIAVTIAVARSAGNRADACRTAWCPVSTVAFRRAGSTM